MNILITGIHGFVGNNLVNALKDHHHIYGIDIVSPEKDGVIETFPWDAVGAKNVSSLPAIDTIIHLAGKAHDTKNQADATIYFDINFGLTKKIFDYFLQSTVKQFIFFSSVKAAADRVEGDFLTEDVVPHPIGPYGESKIKAEEYILNHPATDKKIYIFRPCMIHGPGNKGNLNLLYQVAGRKIPWPLGAFDNLRSFMSIDNLSYIVEQFIVQNPAPGIYHLADDEPLSTNELIRLIAESKHQKAQIWKINQSLIQGIAKTGSLLRLPLNLDRLQKLTENYVVSNQKMKAALGINQLPIDARTGLQRTLASFQS